MSEKREGATKPVNQYGELFRKFPETPDTFTTQFPTYWSPYKTAEEKLDYERRLPIEIRPFILAYFQKHKNEMDAVRQKESISSFLSHVKETWQKHLEVNRAVDCFLEYETNNVFGDWSLKEWELARKLLVAGMDSDHKKTMYSGGIKAKLDLELKQLATKYYHEGQDIESQLLMPSFVTFYEGRLNDHKKYHLSVLQGVPDEELRKHLLEKYHGGDEKVFESRMRGFKFGTNVESLQSEVATAEGNFKERSIKKGYLMLERPDIKDFEALLSWDNTTEYELTYSLKGLPDLFLREEILKRLIAVGYFPPETSVYSLTIADFTDSIDDLREKLSRHSHTRLRPYRQTMDTCGTACVMSILNRKGVPLDQEVEMRIWEDVGKPYNFPGGLAYVLLRHGFHVTYVQETPALLRDNNPEFTSSDPNLLLAAKEYIKLHERAVESGLHFQVGSWDFNRVKAEVSRGNVCILYVYVDEIVSHCIIARGFKNERLDIIDPLGGDRFMSEDQINSTVDTPMGRRMVVVQKLPNDFFEKIGERLGNLGY